MRSSLRPHRRRMHWRQGNRPALPRSLVNSLDRPQALGCIAERETGFEPDRTDLIRARKSTRNTLRNVDRRECSLDRMCMSALPDLGFCRQLSGDKAPMHDRRSRAAQVNSHRARTAPPRGEGCAARIVSVPLPFQGYRTTAPRILKRG